MKNLIADMLSPVANSLHELIMMVPLSAVRGLVFALLAALAVWVIAMRPQLPDDSEKKSSPLSDLRFFALGVLILQALLYIIF